MSHVLTPNWTALPAALLPIAKEQLRIDFTDDDASITRMIGWAIGYFENFTSLTIFSGSVAWSPPLDTGLSMYQCPVRPVVSFTVSSVAGGGDVSSQYKLVANSLIEPVYLQRSDGSAFHGDAAITLTVGFTDPAKLAPSVMATIMRITAAQYENRESISAITVDQIPFWLNDLMIGHWVPVA